MRRQRAAINLGRLPVINQLDKSGTGREPPHCSTCFCGVDGPRGNQVDVTIADAYGHWDYEDIKRLCEYRDRLRAALTRIADPTAEGAWETRPGTWDFITLAREALGRPADETTVSPDPGMSRVGGATE